uniref:Uncharacterized protein n=1 Tax=Nelumbo nucifera TaxID=4432 RepID=A0A822ZGD0_NELNU|nr:TPA_asm: hypothetical protein HUJ06_001790 [Nelumbo nucifera]
MKKVMVLYMMMDFVSPTKIWSLCPPKDIRYYLDLARATTIFNKPVREIQNVVLCADKITLSYRLDFAEAHD